jgi:hypothetical protein
LNCHANRLVDRNLRWIGSPWPFTGHQFPDLGVNVISANHARLDRTAQLDGTRRRGSQDGRSRFHYHNGVTDGVHVHLAGAVAVIANRVDVGARPEPFPAYDRLASMGCGAHDIGGPDGVLDGRDGLGVNPRFGQLAGKFQHLVVIAACDLEDLHSRKPAEGPGVRTSLHAGPDDRHHRRSGTR